MNVRKVKISDVYSGLYDGPHATPPVSESGAVFLGISNITKNGHIDFSNIKYISEEDLPKWTKRVTPKAGDIVFSYEATLNLYAIIPEGFWGCLGRRMALIRPDESKALGKYLYYYFFSDEWRATIAENTITGATVDRIPIAKFPEFPISLPSLEIQKRIVDILSAYDYLIENNQKQIKLLEEAAQRLYKEWFVDLRFPGHEDVQIVDGVPEGWRLGVLSEVASLNVTAIDYDYPYSEIEYVDLGSVNKGHIRGKKKYLLQDAPGRARRLAKHGDVIWGMVRPNLKAYALVQNESSNTVYSTGFAIITAKSVPFTFMYCATTTEEFVGYLVGCTNGAAYPAVKPSHFQDAKILIPSENVLKAFHQITEPIFCKIGYLDEMNNHLTEARDRLLPKLMSGEIKL